MNTFANFLYSITTFASLRMKLDWAKNNLEEEVYKKVEDSYKKSFKYTFIVVIFLTFIMGCIMFLESKELDRYTSENTRPAHVSGEKIWYIENDKKELNLSDYGYDYNDYKDNDKFVVYLNKDNEVLDVFTYDAFEKNANKGLFIIVGSMIGMLIILLCIYVPIAYKTFGKNWRKFSIWYEKANLNEEKFIL